MGDHGNGDFFAVDRKVFARACALGMNSAIALLVLARFSGRDQKTTRASTNAVEKYTSISRSRAKKAIGVLEENGIITKPEGPGTIRKILSSNEADETIWLPNSVVDGAADEVPPIELCRQTADVLTLRLFIDAYFTHYLADNGGLHWRTIRRDFDRKKLAEIEELTIWSFTESTNCVWTNESLVIPHMVGVPDEEGRDQGLPAFWERWSNLRMTGLVETIPHLIDRDSDEGEVIFPLGMNTGEPFERFLGWSAHRAAESLLEQRDFELENNGAILVAIPNHLKSAQLVGLGRLRYRPHTKMTAAWYSEWKSKCEKYGRKYSEILDKNGICNIKEFSMSLQGLLKESTSNIFCRAGQS